MTRCARTRDDRTWTTRTPMRGVRRLMEAARVIIEVTRGLIPGAAPDETTRYVITDREWEDAQQNGTAGRLLTTRFDKALDKAREWADPNATNWVRVDWVWL